MISAESKIAFDFEAAGQEMYSLIAELYPICRSITGDGLRRTLRRLQDFIPLELHEVPSGTQVFDWTVPKEWNIRDAYVKNSRGERVIDFRASNLHVLNYSIPFTGKLKLSELMEHLFSLPDQPDLIPYRTSYYKETWGFCIRHRDLLQLEEDEYEVCVDSTLEPGHLTYGELLIPGETESEVLISCHSCHPSLCNDNLSGVALAAFLAKYLVSQKLRYSYRFLFIPGTIGSITWLALNEDRVDRIKHGLVVACVGDPGPMTYKKSRRGDAEIDQAAIHVLSHSKQPYEIQDFSPYGYDERQYCSPGFNLPVGSLTRTPHGRYPQYHTSADNLDFVRPESLVAAFAKYMDVIDILENNKKYISTNQKCEPQLGKRGLYGAIGGRKDTAQAELAMLWLLNLSDGNYSLLDIATRANIDFRTLKKTNDLLFEHGLLKEF
jgi:aminopeptidase-like protein